MFALVDRFSQAAHRSERISMKLMRRLNLSRRERSTASEARRRVRGARTSEGPSAPHPDSSLRSLSLSPTGEVKIMRQLHRFESHGND